MRDGLTQDTTGAVNALGQYQPNFVNLAAEQDGYAEQVLTSVSVDSNGILRGQFSGGTFQDLAQLAVVSFSNPAGLAKAGTTSFAATANSGNAVVGTANSGGRGGIVGGALEQSNVDLSKELTDMIVAQRGFEVNARLVTTSDRILDTLVNLGR
jgi:flagellar hook protein FlgE